MHLETKFKVIMLFLFISIQGFSSELLPPKEIQKDKILMHYFLKLKKSYDAFNKNYDECSAQEENNTIAIFNYNNPSIKDIDIFNFIQYIYYENQDKCLKTSRIELEYNAITLKSLFNSYMVKDNTLLPHVFFLISSPTISEIKFNMGKSYNNLSINAKKYLEKTLGKKPFNIKPFREEYMKKRIRELKSK